MSTILIIDDDNAICRTLELHFRSEGFGVGIAHGVNEGLELAQAVRPDVIVMDIRMAGESGLKGLPVFRERVPGARVIMITAFHDMETTIEAMQGGADDYIHKPIDLAELDAAVVKVLHYGETDPDDLALGPQLSKPRGFSMVGSSRGMKDVFKTIGRVAQSPATVLISGESGTGKELVARAIHAAGPNPGGPFVAVNCAALVETLLESDMFGHEKGAFTGAVARQAGKFALANGGTIFLDEIGELSATMQAKLLRVLQEKEFTPLGAKEAQTTSARVIAATNADLTAAVEAGDFRRDLYYRLQVVNIHLPPLRERAQDIPELVETLLGRINRESQHRVKRVAAGVVETLCRDRWPGNVRELENVLMKAAALCPGDLLTLDLLPARFQQQAGPESPERAPPPTLRSFREVECWHLARVLETTGWHRGRACATLGISRPRLRRLIALHGLVPPESAPADADEENP